VTTALTIGTFDLTHSGHFWLFREMRKLVGVDGKVVVGLNTDAFVAHFKTRPPIQVYSEREAVLQGCRWIDDVVRNTGGADSRPCIDSVRPDWLVIGSDWCRDGKADDYYRQINVTPEWLDEAGISLVFLPRRGSMSTSELKSRVRQSQ
jgi:cytidyltransferase-like protein